MKKKSWKMVHATGVQTTLSLRMQKDLISYSHFMVMFRAVDSFGQVQEDKVI